MPARARLKLGSVLRKGFKCSLSPLCVNNDALALIRSIVEGAHAVRVPAHQLVRLFILDLLWRDEAIPLDLASLFKDAVHALTDNVHHNFKPNTRIESLRMLLDRDFPKKLPGTPFRVKTKGFLAHWCTYASDAYQSQVKVNVQRDFLKCLSAYVALELGFDGRSAEDKVLVSKAVSAIRMGEWPEEVRMLPRMYALPDSMYGLNDDAIADHIVDFALQYLPSMLWMAQYIESRDCGVRYTVLPASSSLIPGHTFIDSDMLLEHVPVSMLGVAKKTLQRKRTRSDLDEVSETLHRQEQVWRSVLRLDAPYLTCQSLWRFDNRISTDGLSVTIFMVTKTPPDRQPQHRNKKGYNDLTKRRSDLQGPFCRIISVDPGKRNLIYCLDAATIDYSVDYRRLVDRGRIFRYTTQQRVFETRSKERRARAERRKIKSCPLASVREEALRANPGRTFDVGRYVRHLEAFYDIGTYQNVQDFYMRLSHRRDRFDVFRSRQISESHMISAFGARMGCVSVEEKRRTLIAFGDGARAGLQGWTPGPSSRLRRLFVANHFPVLDIPEHYTSKRCFSCRVFTAENRPTMAPFVSQANGTVEAKSCWGLVRCNQCSRLWARDYHACLNIDLVARAMLAGGPRPPHLCRNC